MQPAPLADPSEMSPQERTDELVKSVEEDDLLGVLLVLSYSNSGEVNGRSSRTGKTPLATTLTAPPRLLNLRRLTAEVLLHAGASWEEAFRQRTPMCPSALVAVLGQWDAGGRQQASVAHQLVRVMTLPRAEQYIRQAGLDLASLPPPYLPPPAVSAPPQASPHNEHSRPPRHSYAPSSRRESNGTSRPRRDELMKSRDRSPSPRHNRSERQRSASPRRSSPSRSHREALRQKADPGGFWIFVGNLPSTVAERQIFDILDARGLLVQAIFLSQKPTSRFVFVQLEDSRSGAMAMVSLNGLKMDGRTIVAKPFQDNKNKGNQPDTMGKHDVYNGTRRQADRPAEQTRCGITLMHVSPHARPKDVADFLRPCIPPTAIERIDVKTLGISTLAFVRLYERECGREAILRLDGGTFLGYAVRVGWMEPDLRPIPPSELTRPAPGRSFPARDYHERARSPSPKRRRASQAHEDLSPRNPTPLVQNGETATGSSGDTATTAAKPPSSNSASTLAKPQPIQASSASADPFEIDRVRLRSYGLSGAEIDQFTQVCQPSNSLDPASLDRAIDVKARFGFLPQNEAKKALEVNERTPVFPDDKVQQQRYEAFLRAQAGLSMDYYVVFFAQLFDFSSAGDTFATAARKSLRDIGGKTNERESGRTVDEKEKREQEKRG